MLKLSIIKTAHHVWGDLRQIKDLLWKSALRFWPIKAGKR